MSRSDRQAQPSTCRAQQDTLGRARYRVRQFFDALRAAVTPIDEAYVRAHLSRTQHPKALWQLFQTMPKAEQHHGIHTCQILEERGFTDPDLMAAALLHDVGKSVAPPLLGERVFVVLVERFLPQLAARWRGQGPMSNALKGVRRGFLVRHYHPVWGAEMVAETGASDRIVSLIRHHHVDGHCRHGGISDAELMALHEADEN